MSLDRAIDVIDHVERAPRRTAFGRVLAIDVNGKELCRQSALLHAREIGVILPDRRHAEIVIVVSHHRQNVVVRIDDDRAAMNRERAPPQSAHRVATVATTPLALSSLVADCAPVGMEKVEKE